MCGPQVENISILNCWIKSLWAISKFFDNNRYNLEVEAFYKTIQNRLDYINGAELIANDAIEQILLTGQARAGGLEVLFRKNEVS